MIQIQNLMMPLLIQDTTVAQTVRGQTLQLWALDNTDIVSIAERYGDLSLQLLGLLFVVSIGIYTLRAFEGLDLEGKTLDFLLCGLFILMWPLLVTNLKWAVDSFNAYLIAGVFQGETLSDGNFPKTVELIKQAYQQGSAGLASNEGLFGNLGANLVIHFFAMFINIFIGAAKTIIEVFYNAFFYFFALLGPFVIARSIFSDHLEGFFELVQEFLVIMLWPTTFVLLRGMNGLAQNNTGNISIWGELAFQVSMIVLTFFVPSLTKKFALHIGSSIISPLLRFTGIALGLTGLQGLASGAGKALLGGGFHGFHFAHSAEKYISLGEIVHEHHHAQHAHHMAHKLHHALHGAEHAAHHEHEEHEHEHHDHHAGGTHDHEHHHEGHASEHHHEHDEHHSHDVHHENHAHHAEHHESHSTPSEHGEHHAPAHAGSPQEPTTPAPSRSFLTTPSVKSTLEALTWKAPLQGLNWLNRFSRTFQKNPTEEDFKDERQKARNCLGPKASDKNKDMEKCGIDHRALTSSDFTALKHYRRLVERFHSKYGWLYDFQGHYLGFPDQRPGLASFQKDLDND